MFANKAEAERAARAASRITGRKAEVWPDADRGLAVGFADESQAHMGYISWDELADFLAAGYRSPQEDQTDKRAGLVAEARAHLGAVKRGLVQPARLFDDPVYSQVAGLCATLECVLEVLA
jgi:hypothetical protein